MAYQRITIQATNTKKQTMWLETIKESDLMLFGWKVNKNGERSNQKHLIDKSAITKRIPATMNLHYGELEIV